jgi:hypothetical protein
MKYHIVKDQVFQIPISGQLPMDSGRIVQLSIPGVFQTVRCNLMQEADAQHIYITIVSSSLPLKSFFSFGNSSFQIDHIGGL